MKKKKVGYCNGLNPPSKEGIAPALSGKEDLPMSFCGWSIDAEGRA
jgi:hypothetical protein